MQGFRTIIFGALVAIAPIAVTYFGNVDWTSLGISPTVAGIIGLAIVGLRAITSTPIGMKQ